ncbi:P-loop containing nucleoside triphosphate hydrolase protein [Cladochytrium replicatum]|nr:P-loop containing nucleoside triphosphate hydrolase protein [Cladochytrium replicatum]
MALDPRTGTPSGNISVTVRIRPLLQSEVSQLSNHSNPPRPIIHTLSSTTLVFDPTPDSEGHRPKKYHHASKNHANRRAKHVSYAFDRVLGESATQKDVFEATTKALVDDIVQKGWNGTVFAYGATGCGKTHTITGSPTDPGVIYLTLNHLLKYVSPTQISISYLEIYNETIRDLLQPANDTSDLELREDDMNRLVHVAGLSEHVPKHLQDVMSWIDKGQSNRIKAPTEANAASSRSHAVLRVGVRKNPTGNISSTLCIIDLAGSERASISNNKGERLIEGANINRSLLALGNCINALCSGKSQHVPYRDSKLTRLLKYSLSGGNAKVVMIANISPSPWHYEETHNTLKYANRAKNIKTFDMTTASQELGVKSEKTIVETLKARIYSLEEQLMSNTTAVAGGKNDLSRGKRRKANLNDIPSMEEGSDVILNQLAPSPSTQSNISNTDSNGVRSHDQSGAFVLRLEERVNEISALAHKKCALRAQIANRESSIRTIQPILSCIPADKTSSSDDRYTNFWSGLKQVLEKRSEKMYSDNATLRHNFNVFDNSLNTKYTSLSKLCTSGMRRGIVTAEFAREILERASAKEATLDSAESGVRPDTRVIESNITFARWMTRWLVAIKGVSDTVGDSSVDNDLRSAAFAQNIQQKLESVMKALVGALGDIIGGRGESGNDFVGDFDVVEMLFSSLKKDDQSVKMEENDVCDYETDSQVSDVADLSSFGEFADEASQCANEEVDASVAIDEELSKAMAEQQGKYGWWTHGKGPVQNGAVPNTDCLIEPNQTTKRHDQTIELENPVPLAAVSTSNQMQTATALKNDLCLDTDMTPKINRTSRIPSLTSPLTLRRPKRAATAMFEAKNADADMADAPTPKAKRIRLDESAKENPRSAVDEGSPPKRSENGTMKSGRSRNGRKSMIPVGSSRRKSVRASLVPDSFAVRANENSEKPSLADLQTDGGSSHLRSRARQSTIQEVGDTRATETGTGVLTRAAARRARLAA